MSDTQAFLEAVRGGDLAGVAARLDAEPALAGARDANGVSAAQAAGYHGRRDVLALLVERGAPLDGFELAMAGELDRLRELIAGDPGATERRTPDGWTPLHGAAFFAQPEAVRLLLNAGADVHAVSRNAMANQPLHAALAGRLPLGAVALLLDRGADVNARQHGGYTALHAAAQHGDREMAELLLARGADPSIATDDGRTAADLARGGGHDELAALLQARPAAENPTNPNDAR
jgi:ankyrin repeat protein